MNPAPATSRLTGALVALGLSLPLLADVPGAFTGGDVLRPVALGAVLAVALVLAGLQLTGPLPSRGRLLLAALPLLVACLAIPAAAGEGLLPLARRLTPWLALSLLPLVMVRALVDDRARAIAEAGVRVGAVVAIAWVAFDGFVAMQAWTAGGPLPRAAAGPFGRPGVAGPVVAALGLAAFGARLRRGSLPASIAILGAFVLALGLTRSRTAALAAVGGLYVLAAESTRNARTRRRLTALAGALALLVAVVVFGALPAPGGSETLQVRRGLRNASEALIAERPLTGHGLGRFGEEILRVRDPDEARLEAGRRPTHAHHDLLHVSVEGGVGAGLAWLAFLIGSLVLGVRATRATTDADRTTAAGWTAALATLGIAGLGEGTWIDPAGLTVGLIALTFLDARRARPAPAPTSRLAVRTRQAAWGLSLLALVGTWAAWRGARADHAVLAWRVEHVEPLRAGDTRRLDVLLERHILDTALALDPDDARGWYERGVQDARQGRRPAAAEAFRAALARDPGMTEARLDLATIFEIEDRRDDAVAVLEEARRMDPTRFDVALRLGHLALGPEPVPGEDDGQIDLETVLRRYNEAQRIDPRPIANIVARARWSRRNGDLYGAAAALAEAKSAAGGDLRSLPAEVLFESFRLAEREGAAEPVSVGILTWALRQRPSQAGTWKAEAERFLGVAREREATAKAALAPDEVLAGGGLDLANAQRAYRAATLRLAALLLAGLDDPARELAVAREDAEAGRWREALARYRALLAWTHLGPSDGELPVMLAAVAQRGDLLLEAAKVASRVDGALARTYYARGHALLGAELLASDEVEHAKRLLERAVEDDPEAASVRLAYARALVRAGQLDDAERHLLTALAQDPSLREAAATTQDLVPLRDRPRVRAALAR